MAHGLRLYLVVNLFWCSDVCFPDKVDSILGVVELLHIRYGSVFMTLLLMIPHWPLVVINTSKLRIDVSLDSWTERNAKTCAAKVCNIP